MIVRLNSVTCEIVEFIPENLIEGVIYISIKYETAIHKCCCGCGNKVVTPFGLPEGWKLVLDIEDSTHPITLEPSIGNWNFPCKSHYCIKENKVIWL